MKSLSFQMSNPNVWYLFLNQHLPSKLDNNTLWFTNEIGEGNLTYLTVQEGLWAQEMNFKLNEQIELLRMPKAVNDLFIIDFYLSKSEIIREIDEKKFNLSFENVSLVLTSATTSSKLSIPKNKEFSIFNIVFTRDWLFKNVLIDHEHSYMNIRMIFLTLTNPFVFLKIWIIS